ncbi:probable 28S rRNA (cytosine(4447)-C(5))-methyltransferase, partial [Octopus sinensis]|uniref:Probable 28S rRNA (Cytosine(4447)-C(5))-methyltransferase n=1 Tax=Octopus sinensis TaxID=2607531 RepID=A0A6P7U0W0_9MOLL
VAALMKNSGVLFANDVNPDRCQAVVGNFHRLGVVNVILLSKDGRKIPSMHLNLDRVLLDAPCSGTGVISNDQSVKQSRDIKDVLRTAHLQKELILAAIDSCRPGGTVVYSTCSLLVSENEDVVQYALNNRKVRLVSTGLDFGDSGFKKFKHYKFHPSMSLTRRYYPHVHNVDGFFVAKLEKI